MAQQHRLITSTSKVLVELKRVEAKLARTADNADRMTLLRHQAALGDLRDDLERRHRRAAGA